MNATALTPDLTIPDLLTVHPEARAVLDRYGLRGCGGALGPHESLEFFARAHGVPLPRLIAELRQAVEDVEKAEPSPAPEARPEDSIYRRFFLAGIVATLTAGATWGALLLIEIARSRSFTTPSIFAVNAHAQAQIYGWVGLFILGFAYQAFPRFKHADLAWPKLAFLSFWLMTGGIVVRAFAEALHGPSLWNALALLAGSAQLTAVLLFAMVVVRTFRRSGRNLETYDLYILAAVAWFVAGAAFDIFHLARLLAATSREAVLAQVATYQVPLRDLQIHGLAMMMIFGVSLRFLPGILGAQPPDPRRARTLWLPLQLAVAAEIVLFIVFLQTREAGWALAMWGANVVLAGCAAAYAWNLRLFRPVAERDRSVKFLRAAHLWLFISLAMLAVAPLWSALTGQRFSHAWYGATRHAVTVGFISLTIVGVASKVAPTLMGIDPRRLSSLRVPFLLLNVGCAMRVLFQVGTDLTPAVFPLAGASGVLEVTGLTLWGVHLGRVMLNRARLRPAVAPGFGGALGPDTLVGDLLDTHPRLVGTLHSLGFEKITNPILRRTVARAVTLRQACALQGKDLDRVLSALAKEIATEERAA